MNGVCLMCVGQMPWLSKRPGRASHKHYTHTRPSDTGKKVAIATPSGPFFEFLVGARVAGMLLESVAAIREAVGSSIDRSRVGSRRRDRSIDRSIVDKRP